MAAAAIALAGMAGVSLWIGAIRPGLAAQRSFKTFALDMRTVTERQPVYTPGGPDYEISYYYGAPIRSLSLLPRGRADSTPRYVLIWQNWLRGQRWADSSQVMLTSHPFYGDRLVLLKVDAIRFEQFLANHQNVCHQGSKSVVAGTSVPQLPRKVGRRIEATDEWREAPGIG